MILVIRRMKQSLTDPTWRVLDQPGISLQDTYERQQMEKRWKRRRKGGSSRKGRGGRKKGRGQEERGGRREEGRDRSCWGQEACLPNLWMLK